MTTKASQTGTIGMELTRRLAEAAERLKVPGAAVGIAHGEDIDLVYHGTTSVWNPLPVDENTFFQIGSAGKIHTGTAVMVLVDKGLVDLDAPVRRYIPELTLQDEDAAQCVTVLQLLNHTAGWSGDHFPDTGYGDDALARFMEGLNALEQLFPPGTMSSYNNTAVCVAGRLIEKVSGMPFEAAMQDLVFDPLGLREHLYFPWEVMHHRFVAPHLVDGDTYRIGMLHEPRCLHPAGSEISVTLRDFVDFGRFHTGDGTGPDGQRVLRGETLRLMRTATADGLDAVESKVGISWKLQEAGGVQLLEHGGNTMGQTCKIVVVPEHDFVVAVLTNSSAGDGLINAVLPWVLESRLGIALPEPTPLSLTTQELAGYTGTYGPEAQRLTLTATGEQLVGQLKVEIDPTLSEFVAEMAEQFAEPIAVSFQPVGLNRLIATDGQMEGTVAVAMRGPDQEVSGLIVGGRLLRRVGV